MRRQIFVASIISIIAFGCSSKLAVDWTRDGYSDRSFTKLAVVGVGDDLKARVAFEERAVELFRKKGINAVIGVDIFHPNMSEGEQTAENYIKLVKEHKLDGVLTMTLIDTREATRYEGGENYIVSAGYNWYGNFAVQRYATISTPGYFTSSKSYLIEAVLHNLKGELFDGKKTLVWTGQSSLVDPFSMESAADDFTRRLVSHTVKNGIIVGE